MWSACTWYVLRATLLALEVAAEENILQSYTEIRLLNCENIPVVKVFLCILLLVKSPHEIEIFCTIHCY